MSVRKQACPGAVEGLRAQLAQAAVVARSWQQSEAAQLRCASCKPPANSAAVGKPYAQWILDPKLDPDVVAARKDSDPRAKSHRSRDGWTADQSCPVCGDPLRQIDDNPAEADEAYEGDLDVEVLIENERCGHAYHRNCLRSLIQKGRRTCVQCRTPFPQAVFDRLAPELGAREGEPDPLNPEGNAEGILADFLQGVEEFDDEEEDEEPQEEEDTQAYKELSETVADVLALFQNGFVTTQERLSQFMGVDGRGLYDKCGDLYAAYTWSPEDDDSDDDSEITKGRQRMISLAETMLRRLTRSDIAADESHLIIFLLVMQIVNTVEADKHGKKRLTGRVGVTRADTTNVYPEDAGKRELLLQAFEDALALYGDREGPDQWTEADYDGVWPEYERRRAKFTRDNNRGAELEYLLIAPSIQEMYQEGDDDSDIVVWVSNKEREILRRNFAVQAHQIMEVELRGYRAVKEEREATQRREAQEISSEAYAELMRQTYKLNTQTSGRTSANWNNRPPFSLRHDTCMCRF